MKQSEINYLFEKAKIEDADEILNLYRLVYGKSYPISYGTDRDFLIAAIHNKDTHCCQLARDPFSNHIAGAVIVEIDVFNKIGKVVGLVVRPDYQGKKIGHNLISYITDLFLSIETQINSLYSTTRTVSVGPQIIFYKNNYLPLGIFPNAHRLQKYETVTLFAKFRDGVLEKRLPVFPTSNKLRPYYEILKKKYFKN